MFGRRFMWFRGVGFLRFKFLNLTYELDLGFLFRKGSGYFCILFRFLFYREIRIDIKLCLDLVCLSMFLCLGFSGGCLKNGLEE